MEKIKQLREKTGVGIIECKEALKEVNNNVDAAVEYLRKKGIAKASKREGRETNEGIIEVGLSDDNKTGYILEINSETDFVSKNEKFQDLVKKIFDLIREKEPKTLDELNELNLNNNTVLEEIKNFSGVVGEKVQINNFSVLKGETVGAYSHMGGKIGVLVSLDRGSYDELAKDIAMHIAASNPEYLTEKEVPEEKINKEKEIYREELIKSGKPEAILDQIIRGKIDKYFEEICLIQQKYIKDDKKKIEEVLGDVNINEFIRYSLD